MMQRFSETPAPGRDRLAGPRPRRLASYFTALGLVAVLALAAAPPRASADEGGKTIFGHVERVIISDKGFSVKARLDTGAQTSSLDAHNIQRFRRGEKRYVRFDVMDPDTGEFVTLERELVRNVLIRQHSGPSMRRPVVKLRLCIGHLVRDVEVNLTPRNEFLYPFLIGRSAMKGTIIVDPELTFTDRPTCDPAEFNE
jgi:hypothetical protein